MTFSQEQRNRAIHQNEKVRQTQYSLNYPPQIKGRKNKAVQFKKRYYVL